MIAVPLLLAIIYGIYMRYIQPLKLKISDSKSGNLLIIYHSIHTSGIILAMLTLYVLSIGIFVGINREGLGALPVIGVAVLGLFVSLILLIGKTTLSVDTSGKIRVISEPFSNLRSRKIVTQIEKIYYEEGIAGHRFPPVYYYPIWVKNQLGKEVMLINQIDSEADAIKVVEALRQYLSIEEALV